MQLTCFKCNRNIKNVCFCFSVYFPHYISRKGSIVVHLVNRKPCTLRLKHLLLNPCSLIRDYARKLRDQQCCPYWQGVLSLGSLAWRDVHINGDRDALAKVPFLFSYQLHVASSLELVPRPPLAAFFLQPRKNARFPRLRKKLRRVFPRLRKKLWRVFPRLR